MRLLKALVALGSLAACATDGAADAPPLGEIRQSVTIPAAPVELSGDQAIPPEGVLTAALQFDPEVVELLRLAKQTSNLADVNYESKLHAMRPRAVELSANVRAQFSKVPKQDYALKQSLLTLLGGLAATEADAALLQHFAVRPVSKQSPARDENDPLVFEEEEENVLSWISMVALAKFSERNRRGAENSVREVLRTADRPIAFMLSVELQEAKLWSPELDAILKARGISSSYTKAKGPHPLNLELPANEASHQKPAIMPPVGK
jgi:hypothetical protein